MPPSVTADALKVGTLAKQTGLSVRTLHHYDDIGLLRPSGRTPSGHRVYGAADVARLGQIQALRATGMALGEISDLLDRPGYSPQRVIQLHLDRLHAQIAVQTRLVDRLEQLAHHLNTAAPISVDDLCCIIEAMNAMDKYFTPEQQAELKERAANIPQGRMEEVGREWGEIIPAVRRHMEQGTAPDDPAIVALAERWRALVNEFTGGNREIAKNVRTMYAGEGERMTSQIPNAPTQEMFAYMGKVFAGMPGGGPG